MPQPRKKKAGSRAITSEEAAGYSRTNVNDPTHLFYTTRDVSLLHGLTMKAKMQLGAKPEDVYNQR